MERTGFLLRLLSDPLPPAVPNGDLIGLVKAARQGSRFTGPKGASREGFTRLVRIQEAKARQRALDQNFQDVTKLLCMLSVVVIMGREHPGIQLSPGEYLLVTLIPDLAKNSVLDLLAAKL